MTGYIQPEDYLTAFRTVGTPEQFAEGLRHVLQWKDRMEEYHQRISALETDVKGLSVEVKGLGGRMTSFETALIATRTSLEGKLDTINTNVSAMQATQTYEAGRRAAQEEAVKEQRAASVERGVRNRFWIGLAYGGVVSFISVMGGLTIYAAKTFIDDRAAIAAQQSEAGR